MIALEGVAGRRDAEDPLRAVEEPRELLPRATVMVFPESVRRTLVVDAPLFAAMMAMEDGFLPDAMMMLISLALRIDDVSTPPLVSLQFESLLVTEMALLSSSMLSLRDCFDATGPVSTSPSSSSSSNLSSGVISGNTSVLSLVALRYATLTQSMKNRQMISYAQIMMMSLMCM